MMNSRHTYYLCILLTMSILMYSVALPASNHEEKSESGPLLQNRAQAEEEKRALWPELAIVRPDLLVPPNPYMIPVFNNNETRTHDRLEKKISPNRLTEKGKRLRGIYITPNYLSRLGPRNIIRRMRTHGSNAAIVDTKDDRGRIVYPSAVEKSKPVYHVLVENMGKLVSRFHKSDIYTIGRIVCFKDEWSGRIRSAWAAKDRRTGKTWEDQAGAKWLDPCNESVHDYIIAIAQELEELGFDEVQLDYIRFPVDKNTRYAMFPSCGRKKRHLAIADFVKKVRQSINIPLSVDVFGLTSHTTGDPNGLGQSIEHLAPYVDAITPMLYTSNYPRHYWEDYSPEKTYNMIYRAVANTRRRAGPMVAVRPLLQAFKWRASDFGAPFIANQVAAAREAGSSGFLLWNQLVRYEKAFQVLRGMKRGELLRIAAGL